MREVWLSKKKWQILEKRIADLEEQVQGQLDVKIDVDAIRKMLHSIERIELSANIPPIYQKGGRK